MPVFCQDKLIFVLPNRVLPAIIFATIGISRSKFWPLSKYFIFVLVEWITDCLFTNWSIVLLKNGIVFKFLILGKSRFPPKKVLKH